MGGQISTSNTTEMRYTVTDVDATKATIEYVMTAFETKSSGNEKGAEAMDEVQQIIAKLKDVPVIFETDADGKVQKLVNSETIQEKLNVAIKEFADKMFKMAPEMAQVMKKEDIEKQMHEKLTDAEILKIVADDIFDLYGKTISNGMVEDKEDHGIHMKVTYSVANIFGTQNITAKGVANMSKEETKQLFFEQIDQAGLPDDQVRMIKSNFDQMAAAGMAKIEAMSCTDCQPNLVYCESFSHVIKHLGRCERLPFRPGHCHHSLHPTAQMML